MPIALSWIVAWQTVTGTIFLELNAGPEVVGVYVSGGSSDEGVLMFLYTISEGDATPDLDTDGQNSVVVPEGSSIRVRRKHHQREGRPSPQIKLRYFPCVFPPGFVREFVVTALG